MQLMPDRCSPPARKSKGRQEICKIAWVVAKELYYEFSVPVWQEEYKSVPKQPATEDFEE